MPLSPPAGLLSLTPISIPMYNWALYLQSQASLLAQFQSSRDRKCVLQITLWLLRRTYIFIIWTVGINFNFLFVRDRHSKSGKDSGEHRDWELISKPWWNLLCKHRFSSHLWHFLAAWTSFSSLEPFGFHFLYAKWS